MPSLRRFLDAQHMRAGLAVARSHLSFFEVPAWPHVFFIFAPYVLAVAAAAVGAAAAAAEQQGTIGPIAPGLPIMLTLAPYAVGSKVL